MLEALTRRTAELQLAKRGLPHRGVRQLLPRDVSQLAWAAAVQDAPGLAIQIVDATGARVQLDIPEHIMRTQFLL